MVACACNPSTWEAGSVRGKASMFYRMSSRSVRTVTQRNPISKKPIDRKSILFGWVDGWIDRETDDRAEEKMTWFLR